MAQVLQGYFLNTVWQDGQRDKTHRRIMLDVADMDAAEIAAPLVVGYIAACTDAICISYTISMVYENDDVTLAAGADVSQGAEIVMALADRPMKSASFNIPAPKAAIFGAAGTANANVVLTPSVSAAVKAVQDMFDDTPGSCFISDGEHIAEDGFVRGYRTPRKGGYRLA